MEPKICLCYMSVIGSIVDLLRFDREFEKNGEGYSVDNLFPTPAGLDINDAYLWKQNNWGTPWDICKCFVSKQGSKFEYAIKIAWEAPQGAVLEASRRYPNLFFSLSYGTYSEEGKVDIVNGKAVRVD